MTHIMLDLETWGTRPGSHLRSIGATVFDPVEGTLGNRFYCNVRPNPTYGLSSDTETVLWWNDIKQAEAAKAFKHKQLDLRVACTRFVVWFKAQAEDPKQIRLWAHGPNFDLILLECALAAVGFDVPWHYRAPRDTRTIFEAAGIEVMSGQSQAAHHALQDAIDQANTVIEAYRIMSGRRRDDLLEANNREVERRRAAERLVGDAAALFRTYEQHHMAKFRSGADCHEKAERNAQVAERLEGHLATWRNWNG